MDFRDALLLVEYLAQYEGVKDAKIVFASNGQVQGLAVKVPWCERVFMDPTSALVGLAGFHQVNGQLDVVQALPAKFLNEHTGVKSSVATAGGK